MIDILELLKEKVVVFDGAMGTSIQKKGTHNIDFQGKENNEIINILNPKYIQEIHEDFLKVGAEVIETNTFGALPYLLKEYELELRAEKINRSGVHLALEVANAYSDKAKPRFVSGSMGPGTKLPSLMQISFDDLYKEYYLQAECFISEGVHLIQIETGQDPLQMKTALKAVLDVKKKYKKDIPIFLQATIQDNGQMLVGMDLLTFIHSFREMPIHGLGINCGTGPHKIENYVKILSDNCPLNVMVLPNAGLPILKDGELIYDLSPEQFGYTCKDLVNRYRINGIGGCCGTTSEFIQELAKHIDKTSPLSCSDTLIRWDSSLTSLFTSQEIKTKPAPLIIGERANVNGSKIFKGMLEKNDWDGMVDLCITQQEEGSHVIDVNLNHLDRKEIDDIKCFMPLLNKNLSVPIMIDSTSYEAIRTALKYTSGKVIVNSVNFEFGDDNVIKYIDLCRELNAALVCLTIDEEGMAKSKTDKIKIIERFLNLCEIHFYPREYIFIDCLTFALSTGDDEYRNAGKESLETIKYIKDNYPEINTVMGVSNVSFGLNADTRKILNSVFLYECVKNGLTAAIVNPAKILPINEITENEVKLCMDLIYNDWGNGDPLEQITNYKLQFTNDESQITNYKLQITNEEELFQSVIKGRNTTLQKNISELIKTLSRVDIINNILIPAMKEVGVLFETGKIQLPFVLKSAEIMKKAVDYLNITQKTDDTALKKDEEISILLATVKGDVHDIGKNLVQIIIENNGFKVYDLGVKQSAEEIYQAILKYNPSCIGMSALLIKSTEYMRETLLYLTSHNISIPVICGGAALNQDFVEKELQRVYSGKVVYGKDAFAGLKFIQDL
ncbi:MAG: homocysteine S-methyltransferase family protein [Candidatus Cloacimonetes bacterium]|nr:homocysteine S-methyltransferase family protein [Candidatus Cloacimonadota bacterium]